MRLGVAGLLRVLHRLGERHALLDLAHEIAERSGEAPEHRLHAVAGVLELGQRVQHREPRANRRFIAERQAARARRGEQRVEARLRHRERPLVGEHDVETVRERLVQHLPALRGRDVDEDRPVRGQRPDALSKLLDGAVELAVALRGRARDETPRAALPLEQRLQPVHRDALRRCVRAGAVQDGHALEVEPQVVPEVARLAHQLRPERAANLAQPEERDLCRPAVRVGQRPQLLDLILAMQRIQRRRHVLLAHRCRDVELRGALRNGQDVDLLAAQRRERARRNARRPAHPEPHDRDQRHARIQADAINKAARDFRRERLLKGAPRVRGLGGRDDEADRRLAGGLADHRDGVPRRRQRRERAARDPRHAHHAAALDGDERLAADCGQRLDRVGRAAGAGRDPRARERGVERVLDPQRDLGLEQRDHGARVQHLGAVVGQLGGLPIVQLRNHPGLRDDARIGGQEAVDLLI